MSRRLAGAIDLGGTKILSAIVDDAGTVIATDLTTTEAERGAEAGVDRMAASLRRACTAAHADMETLAGIGVAAAGPLDVARGVLTSPPNLAGWKDVPLGEMLRRRTGLAVVVENDANASALGEHAYGAGRGTRDMVYITVSTGIGGGVIAGGILYRGATGAAGELGHMIIVHGGERCGCGRHGCLEAYASGTAIARDAGRAVDDDLSPLLAEQRALGKPLTAEAVAIAAEAGDAGAARILARAAEFLGVGLENTVHLFNPECIVIGGGATRTWDRLIEPAIGFMRAHAFPTMAASVRVQAAALGDQGGVIGAAALVLLTSR